MSPMKYLPDRNTLKLMRIPFSYFLMPVFFFALSQGEHLHFVPILVCFLVLHLFIYPASNGYNSYMDQDESPIGGLEHPPKPTLQLLYTSLAFDLIGLTLAGVLGLRFFLSVLCYVMASRAYSYKGIRLKKMPVIGFLTVVVFQGGFTFWMVYNAVNDVQIPLSAPWLYILGACSFLIAGVYPLTQIYQHEEDKASGDVTISYRLGYRGTFAFTSIMFLIANGLLYVYFNSVHKTSQFILFQVFLLPVIFYFLNWFRKVFKDEKQASFRNTMRMNWIASTSLNLCFILLLILNILQ
jgi:1,4-dihydroxy-2-naphthoate octaprenyltransferase